MRRPLITRPCIACARYQVSRKRVYLGATTVCARCTATLAPGQRWMVLNCLVCEDCAEHCNRCKPMDRRLQWGEDPHTPRYFRGRAKEGAKKGKPRPPDRRGYCQCSPASDKRLPPGSRSSRRFFDTAHRKDFERRRRAAV
jgi:hypothetical protein